MQVVKDVLDRVGSVLLQSQSLLNAYLDHVLSYSSQRFFFTHHLLTVTILASLGPFFLLFLCFDGENRKRLENAK